MYLCFFFQTFTTIETITNAKSARDWLLKTHKDVSYLYRPTVKRSRQSMGSVCISFDNFKTNRLKNSFLLSNGL